MKTGMSTAPGPVTNPMAPRFTPDVNAEADASRILIMLLTGGSDNGTRATLAFSAASSALAMDSRVTVFLAGEGSHWAWREHIEQIHVPGFPSLSELIDMSASLGAEMIACSTCVTDGFCSLEERKRNQTLTLHPGIERAGFPTVLDALQGARSLTF